MEPRAEPKYPWADLVIALLSVNNYSLEKTLGLFDRLAEAELFDPAKLEIWSLSEISRRLEQAGYDRGPVLTQIFADRLSELGVFLATHGIQGCERLLFSGSRGEITALLSPAKGVGPRVLENFFLLRGTPK